MKIVHGYQRSASYAAEEARKEGLSATGVEEKAMTPAQRIAARQRSEAGAKVKGILAPPPAQPGDEPGSLLDADD